MVSKQMFLLNWSSEHGIFLSINNQCTSPRDSFLSYRNIFLSTGRSYNHVPKYEVKSMDLNAIPMILIDIYALVRIQEMSFVR